jgi:tRNA threonylcarbamoyladenosine modification (KEOPS) complex  Pcc1 subunit
MPRPGKPIKWREPAGTRPSPPTISGQVTGLLGHDELERVHRVEVEHQYRSSSRAWMSFRVQGNALVLTGIQAPDQQALPHDLRVAERRAFLLIAEDPFLRRVDIDEREALASELSPVESAWGAVPGLLLARF